MAYDPDATFNNGSSPLSKDYDRLYGLLVPTSGKCASLEGEMLRASSKIYHDYYCNGFGNNWSGAYNFLDTHLGLKAAERKLLKPYSKGKICRNISFDYNDKVAAVLEDIAERVVYHILAVECHGGFTANTEDMFDYSNQ